MLAGMAAYWESTVAALATMSTSGTPPVSLVIGVYGLFLYMALLALPYLTILGATAFAEERDGGHLDLLCITLLNQRDLVYAKAARLARSGAAIMVLPIVLELLIFAMGWATSWALVLTSLHCLAAGVFWLALGMALSLRIPKTSQGPTLAALFFNDVNVVSLSSTPMHCMFLQIFDNRVEPQQGGSNGLTIEKARAASLCYTLAYFLGAAGMYAWALRPATPWQASWLPHATRMTLLEGARPPPALPVPAHQPELS
jgi:hypothetical protein